MESPKVITWHGEGRSLFYVVVPDREEPLATFEDREEADFLLDVLRIVGARDFCYKGSDRYADAVRLFDLTRGEGEVDDVLAEASDILGAFGVEHVAGPGDTGALEYVNAGETYADTLAHDGARYVVTSWGAFFEGAEEEHAEESGERRCPYCGEWGEPEHVDPNVADSGDLCPHCGNAY